jgi:hypothetical protein
VPLTEALADDGVASSVWSPETGVTPSARTAPSPLAWTMVVATPGPRSSAGRGSVSVSDG